MKKTEPMVIGAAWSVRGTVRAAEDVVLEGQVRGRVELPEHMVTVGEHARIVGDVRAHGASLRGELAGTLVADELALEPGARVVGELRPEHLEIAEGALVSARVSMSVNLPPNLVGEVQ